MHTKGPWKAGSYSSVVGVPITAQPDPKRNTVVLAGTMGAFGDDHRAESEANARLIAAAPDLLEELEAAEASLRGASHDLNRAADKVGGGLARLSIDNSASHYRSRADHLAEVIAKAKGGF